MGIPVFLERKATVGSIRTYHKTLQQALDEAQPRIERLKRARNYDRNIQGLIDEIKVTTWLASLGYDLVKTEVSDDIEKDIDLIVDGVNCSIKAEHTGMRPTAKGKVYHNIYFELTTQHWNGVAWTPETEAFVKDNLTIDTTGFNTRTWYPGWFLFGESEYYVILQLNVLTVYSKAQIMDWVKTHGWQKTLPLRRDTLVGQSGNDTICGYLDNRKVPFVTQWTLPDSVHAKVAA